MKRKPYKKGSKLIAPAMTAALLLSAPLIAAAQTTEQSLFFGSDIHTSTAELQILVDNANDAHDIDFFGLVGDYGYGDDWTGETSDEEYETVKNIVSSTGKEFALSMGNHDVRIADPAFPTGPVVGLRNNEMFEVYLINYDDFAADKYDEDATLPEEKTAIASALSSYIENDLDPGKVLFILCHYPLHSTRGTSGEVKRALALFETIDNAAADFGLDIVVLWGHNHHDGDNEGLNFIVGPGGIVGAGDNGRIQGEIISDADALPSSFRPFHFTYLNAGFVKPAESGDPASFNTVVTVSDTKITVERYRYLEDDIALETTVEMPRRSQAMFGDVNGDSVVNIVDALLVTQYYVGMSSANLRTDLGDVNLDGKINSADGLLMANYYVGALEELPAASIAQ